MHVRHIYLILILLFPGSVFLFYTLPSNVSDPSNRSSRNENQNVLHEAKLYTTTKNKKKIEIFFKTIDYKQDNPTIFLLTQPNIQSINNNFFLKIKAYQGQFNSLQKIFSLHTNVILFISEREKFMSHAMHYHLHDNRIVIPNTVFGSLAIGNIEAKQLYINNETHEFLFKGPFIMNNFTLFSPSTLQSRDKQ